MRDRTVGPRRSGLGHWMGFLVSGGVAFLVDAGVLWLMVAAARINPFAGRLIAIACAMVVSWLMHRRITFDVAAAPSVREFFGFSAVGWSAAGLNYLVYAAILLVWPASLPLVAMTASSLLAAVYSYLGYRFGVFR